MARFPHPVKGRSAPAAPAAFTLVELLVSLAVLSLIIILVGELINSAALSTTLSGKQINTDSQARMLFDRMAIDFSHMPPNTDVDFIFSKQTGSDKMFFYSEAPGYYDTSSGAGLYPSAT